MGTLLEFIQAYYEFLEQDQNVTDVSRKIIDYRDSDLTPLKYLPYLQDEFMESFPQSILADKQLIIKHITDFYKAKGSEGSVRAFFRIMFGEEVDFYYPAVDILRTDSGTWDPQEFLTVSCIGTVTLQDLIETEVITGLTSGAFAQPQYFEINPAELRFDVPINLMNKGQLFIFFRHGSFVQGETLINGSGDHLATITTGLQRGRGRYLDTNGFLDSDKKLQDDFYYQEFSYVIKAPVTASQYARVYNRLLHPTGTIGFAYTSVESAIPHAYKAGAELEGGLGGVSGELAGYLRVESKIPSKDEIGILEVPVDGIGTASTLAGLGETIGDNASVEIIQLKGFAIFDVGSRQTIIGSNTHFTFQLSPGSTILFNDGHDYLGTVASVTSETIFRLSEDYPFTPFANITYKVQSFI
jgi:hypothetical protein